jgi:hypothetical protein
MSREEHGEKRSRNEEAPQTPMRSPETRTTPLQQLLFAVCFVFQALPFFQTEALRPRAPHPLRWAKSRM